MFLDLQNQTKSKLYFHLKTHGFQMARIVHYHYFTAVAGFFKQGQIKWEKASFSLK